MKKVLFFFAILMVFGLGFVSAQNWETKAPANYKITIAKNEYGPGYQFVVNPAWLFNGNQMKQGEKYELEITFTSNKEIPKLKIVLVDGTVTVDYWKELSIPAAGDTWAEIDNIKANTPVTVKITFDIYHTATNATRDANRLVFDYQEPSSSAQLTFSKFTFKRIQ